MLQLNGIEFFFPQVQDGSAFCAYKMVMRIMIRLHSQRSVMNTHCPENSTLEERSDVLVDRAQGDGGNLVADLCKHFFRAGMAVKSHHCFVDQLALMRGG